MSSESPRVVLGIAYSCPRSRLTSSWKDDGSSLEACSVPLSQLDASGVMLSVSSRRLRRVSGSSPSSSGVVAISRSCSVRSLLRVFSVCPYCVGQSVFDVTSLHPTSSSGHTRRDSRSSRDTTAGGISRILGGDRTYCSHQRCITNAERTEGIRPIKLWRVLIELPATTCCRL